MSGLPSGVRGGVHFRADAVAPFVADWPETAMTPSDATTSALMDATIRCRM